MIRRRRGIALFLTLGFTAILVMMLVATISSSGGGNIFTQDYHAKTAALYAAETGLAHLQEIWEENPGWTDGFHDEPTPFGTGSYSISFGPSINNLQGETAVMHSRYGPIGPRTAYVRVEGRAQGQTAVVECILGRKTEDLLAAAIIATGRIVFDGGVVIRGRTSSDDLGLAPVDVISNFSDERPWPAGLPPVYWHDPPGPRDVVQGTIRSANPSPSAISSNLVSIADEAWTDQSPVPVENIPIEKIIASKRHAPNTVPGAPTGPLTGDYYYGGDRTITGDLVLDSANLYIDGDLTVLGSITGAGSIYVGGETQFAGDSEVIANEDGVALYSLGNVHLRGFSGAEWLNEVAQREGWLPLWSQTQLAIERLDEHLRAYQAGDQTPLLSPVSGAGAADFYWRSPAGLVLAHLATEVVGFHPPGITESNLLYKVIQKVKSEAPGHTRDFVLEKFTALRTDSRVSHKDPPVLDAAGDLVNVNIHGALGINYGSSPPEDPLPIDLQAVIEEFIEGPKEGRTQHRGLQLEIFLTTALLNGDTLGSGNLDEYDDLEPEEIASALRKHTHWLDLYNFDRLGSSYFQGTVYTRGAIYASNEITIIGSLTAVKDPNGPATAWTPGNDLPDFNPTPDREVTLGPGDVYQGRGTEILHMDELRPGPPPAFRPVGVRHWLR